MRTSAVFRRPVTPGVGRLTLEAEVTRRRNLYFGTITIRNDEEEVATVTATLAVV